MPRNSRKTLRQDAPAGELPLAAPPVARAAGGRVVALPGTLAALARQAAQCRACPLWEGATQVVFGRGPEGARLMLVGEQPGDQEDLQGLPFVGPAGRVLDQALAEIGLDRAGLYVTNAVKHFKFVMRGKRRLHQKPGSMEIQACHPWLEQELAAVKPTLAVAMGATAVRSLFGRDMGINANRGRLLRTPGGLPVVVTVHPSFLLRLPDEAVRQAERARFIEDLRLAERLAGELAAEAAADG